METTNIDGDNKYILTKTFNVTRTAPTRTFNWFAHYLELAY